ncbi:MAG: hypothetical protein ABW019_06055 [Chitinophagaceae bacterium]
MNVKGFLYNRGKGRTEFRKALLRINDSAYLIGEDTLLLPSANTWLLGGNTGTNPPTDFLGTTDSAALVIKTHNIQRAAVLGNGKVLIGTSTDQGSYQLQVHGRTWTSKDMMVNGLTVGKSAGTSSSLNTAVGINVLASNTDGIHLTGIGYEALKNNTTGTINTGVGYLALTLNTTGNYNTGIGAGALYTNTNGNSNTAVGAGSLGFNGSGSNNTAMGYTALYYNTEGSFNTGIGRGALAYNTSGNYNTGVGVGALGSNTNGYHNTATGNEALSQNTTGFGNTAFGYLSLFTNKTGYSNTAIGSQALRFDSTGNNNVAIGNLAGITQTGGDNNIYIGSNAQPNIAPTASNQLNIGNCIYGNNGNIGINVAAPTAKTHLAAGTTTANTAPLKFTSGSNLATPENGAVEYDGTNYFVTSGGNRHTLAKTFTATSTLNFPNTASQGTADLTITVTGAADGDAVCLGIPNAAIHANSSYMAWVSAANTVTIRFTNDATGSIDPASSVFRATVIKY